MRTNQCPGLYAAGEAAGGSHGASRFGGSALSDCLVFGAASGVDAAAFSRLGQKHRPTGPRSTRGKATADFLEEDRILPEVWRNTRSLSTISIWCGPRRPAGRARTIRSAENDRCPGCRFAGRRQGAGDRFVKRSRPKVRPSLRADGERGAGTAGKPRRLFWRAFRRFPGTDDEHWMKNSCWATATVKSSYRTTSRFGSTGIRS